MIPIPGTPNRHVPAPIDHQPIRGGGQTNWSFLSSASPARCTSQRLIENGSLYSVTQLWRDHPAYPFPPSSSALPSRAARYGWSMPKIGACRAVRAGDQLPDPILAGVRPPIGRLPRWTPKPGGKRGL
ncbi:MAG: hypothetical protein ACLSHC_16845 [Bilophila wadsworthia]